MKYGRWRTALQSYNQLQTFRNSLPRKPYCTDEPEFGLKIRPALHAVKHLYIQPNEPFNRRWFIYDVDRPGAAVDWYDRDCPPPNIVAMNRENGHAHLFYGLDIPVWQQFGRKDPAYRFSAAVDVALTRKLDADPGYAKLITKNPLRPDAWEVLLFQRSSYDLNWISDYLDLEPYRDSRRNLPAIGLGRNCTLFNRLRMWAYRMIRREWLSMDFWMYYVGVTAMGYNDFPHPLPLSEIRCTAKSVGGWVWRNMSSKGFERWAENRRTKSLRVRQEKADETREKILQAFAEDPKATQRAIAERTGVSQYTVFKALKTPATI